MDSMPDDACAEWRDSLAYAIESLKVDEAYQIMYEGGEIFTKDEVVSMFKEVKEEVNNISATDLGEVFVRNSCKDIIQQKINTLKEE